MKKLFLQSGKLMCGEFPIESEYSSIALEAAKDSAVEVVNKHDCFPVMTEAGIQELKEGQLYDLPKGWTVEIEERMSEGWVPSYNDPDNSALAPSAEIEFIARLIPIKQSGIVATGLPEVYPPPQAESQDKKITFCSSCGEAYFKAKGHECDEGVIEEVINTLNASKSVAGFRERLKEKFTITRKP